MTGRDEGRRDRRIRLGDARRALQRLLRDPEQTQCVFEISAALAGRQPERLLARVRRSAEGAALLAERPAVDRESCDLRELLRLPHGTFGYEFAHWMLANDFEPGLVARPDTTATPRAPDVDWLGRRMIAVHDFWHVLSGYNRDPIGELGVLAFSFGQLHARGVGFILGTVLLRSLRQHLGRTLGGHVEPWPPLFGYLWRAYRRGRRASFLAPLILEDSLCLPLDSVRQKLRIEPLEVSFGPDALPPVAPSWRPESS